MPYASGTVTLGVGDVLSMFTDGVTEAMSPEGEEWGEERLEPLLVSNREKSAEDILKDVHEAIKEFTDNAPVLSDDLTMIVVKRVS